MVEQNAFEKRRHLLASVVSLGAVLIAYGDGGRLAALLVCIVAYAVAVFCLGGWRFAYVVCRTIRRDIRGLLVFFKMRLAIRRHVANEANVPSLFNETVIKFKNKVCFYFEDQQWTFSQVDRFSNQVGRYFLHHGSSSSDVVALMMESRPEFVCFWLGLAKVGISTALLNSKLRLQSLAHSVEVVNAKCVIYDQDHAPFVEAAMELFPADIRFLCYDTSVGQADSSHPDVATPPPGDPDQEQHPSHANSFNHELSSHSTAAVPKSSQAQTRFGDILIYIFTSGTTGLPKAALIRQQRFYVSSFAMSSAFSISPDEVVYCSLPLYHAVGNNIGVGLALMKGCSVVLSKFSARRFWDDCRKFDVTVIQYIGEICRYLLAQPKRDDDEKHRVRLALGNGLRPQIWREFQERFAIKDIGEFYGATEGNANMLNTSNHAGAVGFTSPLFKAFHPISFVKMDDDWENALRDEHGLCVHCDLGEEGQLVGLIPKGDRLLRFDGYVNQQATKKKVLRDVWRKGDAAFASGDIMLTDELGYVYFRDRIGDTFRWKGENVSTAEVEAVLMDILGLEEDVAVFGVSIPGTEGRAGMAVIYVGQGNDELEREDVRNGNICGDISSDKNKSNSPGTIDLRRLESQVKLRLPVYAHPVFLRFISVMEATGTFKIKKSSLKEIGFDLRKVDDPFFVLDAKTVTYAPLTEALYEEIHAGNFRC